MPQFLRKNNIRRYKGKAAVVRIDLNVDPRSLEGLYRLRSSVPTIMFLRDNDIRVVLVSHRGRPDGVDRELSLRSFAKIIEKEIGEPVHFVDTFDFGEVRETVASDNSSVFLLENIRFLLGEESDDESLAEQLASLGDIFVNEAFAVSHRAHASVHAIAKLLPSFGGIQFEREIKALSGVLKRVQHPFVCILGGAKAKDKLPLLECFWKEADLFLTAGVPGNTLLAAQGIPMHGSLYEEEFVPQLKKIAFSAKVLTPSDARYDGVKLLDIGEETAKEYAEIIGIANTIIWNGPVGLYEKKAFSKGTAALWEAIVNNKKATIVIGGGETIASFGTTKKKFSEIPPNVFLSTGGGAMLEYLAGKKMPGIEVLK